MLLIFFIAGVIVLFLIVCYRFCHRKISEYNMNDELKESFKEHHMEIELDERPHTERFAVTINMGKGFFKTE